MVLDCGSPLPEVVILDALSDAQTAELLHKAKQAQLPAQQLSSSAPQ